MAPTPRGLGGHSEVMEVMGYISFYFPSSLAHLPRWVLNGQSPLHPIPLGLWAWFGALDIVSLCWLPLLIYGHHHCGRPSLGC